jgi:hypothetical protein
MSRRRPRRPGEEAPPREDTPSAGGSSKSSILGDVAILVAVFAVAVGIAELAGAASLGVSFGIGQIAFAITLIVLLTRE